MLDASRMSGWARRGLVGGVIFASAVARSPSAVAPSLDELAAENRALQAQVQAQQQLIERLQARMDAWEGAHAASAAPASAASAASTREPGSAAPAPVSDLQGQNPVRLSAEAGVGYFSTGQSGDYPGGEFRVDEVRIYLEAQVAANAFFHAELDPTTREGGDDAAHLGELYADLEDVWGPGGAVNLRAGRINIPFGEEYQHRDAMENPLISHSVSDLWGFDGGLEAYGAIGPWSYTAALLSGGKNALGRGHSSFSAAGRIGYDPSKALGFSASVMRTGRLNASADRLSAIWFGNAFFVGLPGATQFWTTVEEGDIHAGWSGGRVRAAIGQAQYRDNNPAGGSARSIDYGLVEVLQNISDQLYAAVRYSGISAPRGYRVVGNGDFGEYLFSGVLTRRLERLSVGAGFRFADPLVLKIDYSPEWGRTTTGAQRGGEQFFGTELALKF